MTVSLLPERRHITGVVLAGGRGSRMGGCDKGLQVFAGEPLAARALRRLAPQTGALLISANRELDTYRSLAAAASAQVVPDTLPDFPGPLAGILAAMRHSQTAFIACVPCDAPFFPDDLVVRLAEAFSDPACVMATACSPATDTEAPATQRSHPVFALIRTTLAASLDASLQAGERRVNTWRMRHNGAEVAFADPHAFYNVNTLEALEEASRLARQ